MTTQKTIQITYSSGDATAVDYEEPEKLVTSANVDSIESIIFSIDYNLSQPLYRIFVLFPDESVNYEIPSEDIILGGSYNENYQDGQRRSLSFSLYNDSGKYIPTINTLWAGTRLRLDLGVKTHDDHIVWFQKGVFVISKATPSLTPSGATVNIEAGDKFLLFDSKIGTLDTVYEIDTGVNIHEAIESILALDMGNGNPIDPKRVILHESLQNKTTQAKIIKSAGDTLGSILLELATQLSAEIFYNSLGYLTIIPTEEVDVDTAKALIYSYDAEMGDLQNLDFTFDMSAIINRIIIVGATVNGNVCKAIAVNDDINSPVCYQRIGYRTAPVINDTNITTDYLAEERANYELRKTLVIDSSTSITVAYNPLLSVNNLISISSEAYDLRNSKFLIKSLSYTLDYNGNMSIRISNLENLPNIANK